MRNNKHGFDNMRTKLSETRGTKCSPAVTNQINSHVSCRPYRNEQK